MTTPQQSPFVLDGDLVCKRCKGQDIHCVNTFAWRDDGTRRRRHQCRKCKGLGTLATVELGRERFELMQRELALLRLQAQNAV